MSPPKDLVQWITDPSRTADDLYTVELLLEGVRYRNDWPFQNRYDFDAEMEKRRRRKLNPLYRSSFRREELLTLARVTDTVTNFHSHGDYDRPVRDLHALTFFPMLKDISLSGSDVVDLSPLFSHMHIERFSIGEYGDFNVHDSLDFTQCGEMPKLSHLHLSLRTPWPNLRAIANWPALIDIKFNGNIQTFEEVKELPAARVVSLTNWPGENVPIRDLKTFPRCPQIKQLTVHKTVSLKGIERYPSVVNLDVAGIFRDLTPLAALTNVTALTLTGEHFKDLAPLARMPRLREVHIVRERVIDLAPLADAPQLRRVTMDRCLLMRTELAALNAGLIPEAFDFHAETPRQLGPLKFFLISKENKAGSDFFNARAAAAHEVREDFYSGDAAFAKAESRIFTAILQTRLDALLGKGWGLIHDPPHFIDLKRFADTIRLREVVQVLREESARLRFPWSTTLIVEPHGDMSEELEEIGEREQKESQPDEPWCAKYYEPEFILRENEEDRRRQQERFELIQNEHRVQLGAIEDLDLIEDSAAQKAGDADDEEEDNESAPDQLVTAVADDGGGVAIAPPPPAPPETKSLGEELKFYLTVHEDCMVVNSNWVGPARYGLGEAPVEWTDGALFDS